MATSCWKLTLAMMKNGIFQASLNARHFYPDVRTRQALLFNFRCAQSVNYSKNCNVQCWKCGRKTDVSTEERFICSGCQTIQPPHPCLNHFDVIGTEETFNLDVKKLTSTFRKLQMELHPDKFSQKSKEEKEFSALQSSLLNKAYFTLLKPVSRGLYMLELNGKAVEEGDVIMDPEFLMDVMETNEKINNEENTDTLKRIEKQNVQLLDKILMEVSQCFERGDVEKARELLTKIKYYSNIDEKIKEIFQSKLGQRST